MVQQCPDRNLLVNCTQGNVIRLTCNEFISKQANQGVDVCPKYSANFEPSFSRFHNRSDRTGLMKRVLQAYLKVQDETTFLFDLTTDEIKQHYILITAQGRVG